MACTNTCRSDESASACKRGCGSAIRRQISLLEPDLAGYALMGAQIELLAALGTQERPRL
jgi:hypothetical protein